MSNYFKIQFTLILIAFSLFISSVVALFDYGKLKENVQTNHEIKMELAENAIISSLHTIDKAYLLLDSNRADKMKKYSEVMLEMYTEDEGFENWDFASLKKRFGMDIYIINSENVIVQSSYKKDIGLDYEKCCTSIAKLLDVRRTSNVFHHDGMDIQQDSREIKKVSYMPTPDQKYIIELSVSLENNEIFRQFNFKTKIKTLTEDYDAINSINVYNSGGLPLGYTTLGQVSKKLDDEMRPIFNDAVHSMEAKESIQKSGRNRLTYRYIPYTAEVKQGLSTNRVVEIVFNDTELKVLLEDYQNKFIFRLIVIVIASVVLSIVIARLVSKPIYLAFHDSLTGLKNRAAFEDEIEKRLRRKEDSIALMMIDLDNFKSINDVLGHSEGDRILKYVGKTIQEIAGSKNIASRVGGDEFVVMFSGIQKEEMKKIAELMVEKVNGELSLLRHGKKIEVSISVGVAYAIEGDEVNTLYDRADSALYISKGNGKNQFTIYSHEY